MNDERDDQELRGLFAQQARADRRTMPGFEETLRQGRSTRRAPMERLAVAAGLLIVAGTLCVLAYQHMRSGEGVRPQQAALPNLLEGLDDASNVSWQSPTAFLLDMSGAQVRSESAPSPGNGSETRHSNG